MNPNIYLWIPLLPLIGALVVGLPSWFGRPIRRPLAHWITILSVAVSCALSLYVLYQHYWGGAETYNGAVYTWAVADGIRFEVGFLVDRLTAMMMAVVTFVSLMVHIYTIGYMQDDPGYQRFFSYIALFTFSMLMLVMANNFMQLFFGWEAVGLVSYLLIGFWYQRPTAIFANLKAFLVNRVGDFGFVLGIAAVLAYYGSIDYAEVFQAAAAQDNAVIAIPGLGEMTVATLVGVLLFIGAMGKSAQVPLHVWLPDSMEGPTPISALIHAATMVTAGIFMVARMSPIYELSDAALSLVMLIGAVTAFFMGLVGIVQNDIKRVVAYSTLSQLGYMFVALGASAYAAGVFHLMTHAFFKALLFLGAGSVIIAMHHEQDMTKMGGLRKHMPITHWTMLIATLALIGTPFFSGFYSKDAIIEAVGASDRFGATIAYWAVLLGVFVTSLYSFRLYFMVFWGEERMGHELRKDLRESPAVVTVPLILLAIPSVLIGWFTIGPMLFGDFFADSIRVLPQNDVLGRMGEHWTGPLGFTLHGLLTPTFWLALAGVIVAWFLYVKQPGLPEVIRQRARLLYTILDNKYGFDALYIKGFAGLGRGLGNLLWRVGDAGLIDGVLVNGTARTIGRVAAAIRGSQSGYLYHYAFAMIIGLLLLLTYFIGTWQGWFA
ncbi:MAG: NADH-quinone oxidoreductase subunit L [Xanthomonadaceae bacterium]|nr:NADH-quinone oxidoreductase subunit L [Xanthomonadaceae bacterium]